MKRTRYHCFGFFWIMVSLFLLSCNKEQYAGDFYIIFEDGTELYEGQIAYYDSSQRIFLLNEKIYLDYGSDAYPLDLDRGFRFTAYVDGDTVYSGIVASTYLFSLWPSTTFIDVKTYPDVETDVLNLSVAVHEANDVRLIDAFQRDDKLLKGITCSLLSISKVPEHDSTALISVKIKNHDKINYYIPDPEKMSDARFHYLGCYTDLLNLENNKGINPLNGYPLNMNNLSMDDLSILEAKSEVTYTYKSSYSTSIAKGMYSCYPSYGTLKNHKPFSIPLDHADGRVWVGHIRTSGTDLMIE